MKQVLKEAAFAALIGFMFFLGLLGLADLMGAL